MEQEASKAEELRQASEEALREQQKKLEIARREALLASNEQDAAAKLRAEEERQLKLLAEARKQQEALLQQATAAREAQEATAAKLQDENRKIAELNERVKSDSQQVEAKKLRAEAEARKATLEKEQREREAEVARLERQKEEAAARAIEQEAAAETARLDATRTASEREQELQAQALEKRRNEEALAAAQQRQLAATEAKLAAAREALSSEEARRKVLAEAVELDAKRAEAAESVARLRAEHDHAMAEKERIEREVTETRIQLDTLKKEKSELEAMVAQRKSEEANLQTIQTDRNKLEEERSKLEDERAMLAFQIDESRMKLGEFDKAREAKRQELSRIDERMNLSSKAIDEVNAQLVLEQENLRRMVDQRKEEEKRLETLRENIRQLQANKTASDNETVGKLQGELATKEQALAERDKRLAELETRLGRLSGELDSTRKQAGTESDETAKLRSRLEERTRDYERLDREYRDATRRLAELKAGRDEGMRKAGELETRLEDSVRRMDEINKEYNGLLAERERWADMNKAEKQEVSRLKKDLAKGQTEYAKLLKSREAMEKKLLVLSRDLARAEEEKAGLERGLQEAQRQLEGQRGALTEARKRSDELEQTRQARGEDLLKIQADLDASRQALAGYEAEVARLRQSEQLGEADKARLAETEQQLEAEKGRGSQLDTEKDKLQQLIAALGAQREAEKKEVERLAFRVKELEVTGSQADKALQDSAKKLGSLKERLDKEQALQVELVAKMEASKAEAAEWKNRYEQLVVASQKNDQEKKNTEAEVTRLRAHLEQQRNDLDALRQVTDRNRTSGAETTARFEELQSQVAKERDRAEAERKNSEALQAELASTRETQAKAQIAWKNEQARTLAELETLRAAGMAQESKISELKAQLAKSEENRNGAEAEAEALAKAKTEYEQSLKAREQEVARLKAERDLEAQAAREAQDNAQKADQEEQNNLQARERELARLKAERDAEAKSAKEARENGKLSREQETKYQAELKRRDRELSQMEAQIADLKASQAAQDKKKQAELASLKKEYDRTLQDREKEIARLKADRDAESAKAAKARDGGKLNKAQEAKFQQELKRRDEEVAKAEAEAAALKASFEEAKAQAQAAKEEELEAVKTAKDGELRAREAEIEVLKAKLLAQKVAEPKSAVKAIDFDGSKGRAVLKISVDGQPNYQVEARSDKDYLMIFDGTSIPAALQRTLDTQEFASPVAWVSSYEDPARKGRTVVSVHLKEPASNSVISTKGSVQWSFKGGSEAEGTASAAAPSAGAQTAVVGQAKGGPQTNAAVVTAGLANPQNPFAVVNPNPGKKKKKYSGKRINLSIKDADIQHVLAFLSRVGGVNIVTSEGVRGNVSFYLEDVPWDLALDMILKSSGMDYVAEEGIYRVAPQAEIQKEYEVALDKQKKITELKQLQVKLIPVNYADADELAKQVKSILSDKGQISVDKRTNTLIVKDIEEHVAALDDLVRRLDAQTPQVLIEARIVEASNDFTREVGVQWGGSLQASPEYANQTGLIFPSSVGLAGGSSDQSSTTNGLFLNGNPNYAVNLPAAAGQGTGGSIGLSLGSVGGAANLYLRLSAAEAEGVVKIISAPRISTVDNTAATIQQGVSFPVSVVSAQGVNTQFFDANLKLDVVPHVTQDGNIQLKIDITKNEPDFSQVGANGTPTIRKKEAHTELLLKDGDTTVIGGIFTRSSSKNFKKVPFFADIPLLGWFFRSNKEADQRSEMLIFITPRIVNRQAARVDTVVD
jgi:type IV pilus assembly protein PilQ